MKKALLAVLAILIFCSAGMAAIKDSPDGFRGIKWGQPPSALGKYTTLLVDGATIVYTKNDDKLKIGGADLKYIAYVFWENKFMSVIIRTEGLSNSDALKAAMFERYGEPQYEQGVLQSDHTWSDKNVLITYTYESDGSKASATISGRSIFHAKQEREKAAAQKGAEDF